MKKRKREPIESLKKKLKRAVRRIKELKKKLDRNPSFEIGSKNVTTTLNGHKDEKSMERYFKWEDN